MNTKTLQVRSYVRKSPADPHAEAKAATTAKLREEVAIFQMVREIERIVERERAAWE